MDPNITATPMLFLVLVTRKVLKYSPQPLKLGFLSSNV